MTRQEFAAVMAYLAAGCGKPLNEEALRVYHDLLHDLPLEALQIAAKRALLESTYPVFPPVGTLRQLAVESMQPRVLSALQAWRLVRKELEKEPFFGTDGRKAMAALPESVRRIAEQFGWSGLRESARGIVRTQFMKAWKEQEDRERNQALLPESMRQRLGELRARPETSSASGGRQPPDSSSQRESGG